MGYCRLVAKWSKQFRKILVLGTFLLQHLCTSGKKKIHLDHLKLGAINATFDAQPAIHDDEDITLMMFSYTVNTIPPLSYFILVRKTILEKKKERNGGAYY
jgi:hypothetical protein